MTTSIGLEDLDTTLALASSVNWEQRGDSAMERAEEPPAGMSLGGLVARDRELASLDRALWVARRGRSEVIVLRGVPGMGKSSLLQAAIGRARDVRNVALQGTLYLSGSVPEGGWPQPIIDILDEFSSPEPVITPDAPVVVAMIDALRRLAGHSLAPLLLSVDDCHLLPGWFTAALIEAVGTQLQSTSIVLVLSASALPGTPMGTDDELGTSSYDLRGLNVQQSKLLLERRADRMPVPRVLLELVQSTGGNPEAMLDICYRLSTDELNGRRPLPDPLPLGPPLVAKFARRFEGLPEETQVALSVISAGRIPFDTLRLTLADLGIADATLKPAQEAGLLVISRDRLDFRDPIERSAVYWLSTEETRSRAHRALSKTLLTQERVELGAYHATRCESGADNGLARLHFEAARIAIDRRDPEAAVCHHEIASEFAETNEATAHHLVLAAALLMTIGRIDHALTFLDRASQMDPSDHLRGQAAYLEARARMSTDIDPEVADDMIAAADLCEGEATDWAVMMLVDATACLLTTGSSNEALSVARRACELARAVGAHHEALAQTALAVAGNWAGQVDADPGQLVAATNHLIALTDRFRAAPQLGWQIAICLLEQGHPKTAMRWADWLERCAHSVGDQPLAVIPDAVRGAIALRTGNFDASVAAAQLAVDRARACGDQVLAAQTLGLLIRSCSARGLFARGFAAGAQQFALSHESERIPRIQTLVSLAAMELQLGRVASSYAWLQAANDEFGDEDGEVAVLDHGSLSVNWSIAFAELVLLTRRDVDVAPVAQAVEAVHPEGKPSAWLWWIRAMTTPDPTWATTCFETASTLMATLPFAMARLRLQWGARLADWGQDDQARSQLEQAQGLFRSLRAEGWEEVAHRELATLPALHPAAISATAEETSVVTAVVDSDRDQAMHPAGRGRGIPEWEITLLGSFSVRQQGRPVSLPISLAVQALKIVTLRRRISVDELVELLWPEADPGVGNRRLRNVLWRNRVSCGDLLCRDGNFICLASDAVVDADVFRAAAERAIEAAGADQGLVREALALYPGELLPGDHYVDWPTARRESLAQLYMSLLDLLLDQAIEDGQTHEALGFLDRLIEADPYEERYYVRAAELHAAAGNVSRALSALSRADRTLTDLGVGPSPMVERVRQKLAS